MVATVDSSGVMTAVGVGSVTLTATATVPASSTQSSVDRRSAAAGSRASGSIDMIVVKRVSRVEITPASVSFDGVGVSGVLRGAVYDADGNEMQATVWGWSSADDEVARVNASFSGLRAVVEAIGEGMTTVSLSVNGSATGSASVTVTLPTARVDISPDSLTFDALGQTKSVTVRVLDGNGDEDENASFSYTSTFSPCCGIEPGSPFETLDIEKVDGGLEITAEGTGSGTITIRSPGVEPAILLVTVYQDPVTLELSPDSVSLEVGGTATLSATLMDANGHDLPLAGFNQGLVGDGRR